jgi:PAS domain S-box-containing protein
MLKVPLSPEGDKGTTENTVNAEADNMKPGSKSSDTLKKCDDSLLCSSEEKFSFIFQNSPNAICISTLREGRYVDVNDVFIDKLGYGREEIIGRTSAEINLWVDINEREVMIRQLSQTGKVTNLELRFRDKQGLIHYGLTSASKIKIGTQECLLTQTLDISACKLTEEKFHKIFMTSPDCIVISRLMDGLLIDVNKGFEDIVGWKRDSAIGKKTTEPPLNLWVHLPARELMTMELKTGRDVLYRELEFKRYDGSVRNGIYSAGILHIRGEECLIFIMKDITDQKHTHAELRRTLESLRKAVGATIQVLVSALEAKDPYTAGHQSRSANLARSIATEMGLPYERIEGIRMAGIIHDIGKLSIPSEILTKPTKLTSLEFSLIKEHPRNGYEMLKHVESPWPLAQIIYQHHERIDGSGYPNKLKGNEIILEARIIAVADVVEAMASHRPYRASLGIETAINEIEVNRGILYDESVVDVCVKLFREKGYQLANMEKPGP